MAIAKVLSDSTGDSATGPATLTVSKPTGGTPDATNVLLLSIGCGATSASGSYTAPSGWTLASSLLNQGRNANEFVSGQVFWALGNVANLGFTKSGTVGTVGWVMVCFSGVDTTTPIDATGTANSSIVNAATLTTNAVTIATANAWHCVGFYDWLGGTFSATGFTNAENAASNESAALLYNTTPKSTGGTGTLVVTSSASATNQVLIGVPFALRPAASAAAPAGRVVCINQAVMAATY